MMIKKTTSGLLACGAALALITHSPDARGNVFELQSGVTSVELNLDLISSAAGLNLTGSSGLVPGAFGEAVGFPITPSTTFSFSLDPEFAPVGGTIEHSGTLTFNDSITVGNFSIGFDPDRVGEGISGFFVRNTFEDTAAALGILFDLGPPTPGFDFDTFDVSFTDTEVLMSPEFANALELPALAGANVGSAQINAAAIPEPSTYALIFGIGILALAGLRRKFKA